MQISKGNFSEADTVKLELIGIEVFGKLKAGDSGIITKTK